MGLPPQKPRGLPPELQPRIKPLERIEQERASRKETSTKPVQVNTPVKTKSRFKRKKIQKEHDATSEKKNEDYIPLSERERTRSKSLSVLEGSLNSVTVGLTSNFVGAFAIALGVSNLVIGMLATLPSLIAAVVQLLVTIFRKMFATRKKHIIFFAVLQALMWLPLIFAPQLHTPGPWIILFVTLNTVFGMLIGPVWNSWMGDIIEEEERGRFFGRRNMFTGMIAFISTIAAGWILTTLKLSIHPLAAFGILFALACVFRLMSAYYLSKMSDPPEQGLSDEAPDPIAFIIRADRTELGKFTIFLMLFNLSVYLAAPFFSVYQLSILHFDYFTFTMLACASAISSFVTMIFWGKYVDDIGSRNVLVVCGFLIPFVPLFWALTTNVWLLLLVEAFSGIVWAGFTLSTSTYLFDATERKNRTRELAEYTLMIHLAIFIGAMAGSAILGFFDKTDPRAFITIFIVSAIFRLLTVALFYKSLRELRIVEVPVKDRVFKKFVSIRPHHGIMYEPAVENRRLIGQTVMKPSKEIAKEIKKSLAKPKIGTVKRMEIAEDEQDLQEYKRKLK